MILEYLYTKLGHIPRDVRIPIVIFDRKLDSGPMFQILRLNNEATL